MKRILLTFALIFPLAGSAQPRQVLHFNLRFGIIKGGESALTIADTVYQGKKAIFYSLEYRTTGVYDKLFSIYDVYESIVDPKTMLPVKSIRNIREQTYRYYDEVEFYRTRDSMLTKRNGWQYAPKNLVDPLSVFFYFTESNFLKSIRKGETTTLPLLDGDNLKEITIRFAGEEVFQTEDGPAECYVFSSQIYKGKNQKRQDELKFYISKKERAPVYFEIAIKAGIIKAFPKKIHKNKTTQRG